MIFPFFPAVLWAWGACRKLRGPALGVVLNVVHFEVLLVGRGACSVLRGAALVDSIYFEVMLWAGGACRDLRGSAPVVALTEVIVEWPLDECGARKVLRGAVLAEGIFFEVLCKAHVDSVEPWGGWLSSSA